MATATSQRRVDASALLRRGAIALALALAANLALAWVALTVAFVDSQEFFQYGAIVLWTTLGIAGATAVYGVVARQSATPARTFLQVAAIALVVSFLPDIGLAVTADAVTTSEAIGLMILHVPPAVVAVLALPETSVLE